MAPLDVEELAK